MNMVSSSSDHQRGRHKSGVLLKIAYEGSAYSGLAIQDNATTVAGTLQRAIRSMDPESSNLRVCSRTDAGVHARGQYVAFDTNTEISMRGWLLGITGELPHDIAVLSAARIQPRFELSKAAVEKTYRYTVLQGTIRDPFLRNLSWRVSERLNHSLMRQEAGDLVGTHDFRAFRGRNDFRTETVRTISDVAIAESPENRRELHFTVRGNAFLYHMMRIISGTLVDVGRGKLPRGTVKKALQSGNRLDLGMTAPASGLCLLEIQLRDTGTDEWPYHLDGAPADEVAGDDHHDTD